MPPHGAGSIKSYFGYFHSSRPLRSASWMMNLRFLYSSTKYFLHHHAAAAAPTPPHMHIKSLSGCSVHLASALRETITLHTELSKT